MLQAPPAPPDSKGGYQFGRGGGDWHLLDDFSLTSWSKDGSRIAILTDYYAVPYTVARDGTDSRVLVEKDEDDNLVAAEGRPLSEGQTVQTIHPDNWHLRRGSHFFPRSL